MNDILGLGHNFIIHDTISYRNNIYYICDMCNIIIFKKQNSHEHYYISTKWNNTWRPNLLDLTCNEVIIKNILE